MFFGGGGGGKGGGPHFKCGSWGGRGNKGGGGGGLARGKIFPQTLFRWVQWLYGVSFFFAGGEGGQLSGVTGWNSAAFHGQRLFILEGGRAGGGKLLGRICLCQPPVRIPGAKKEEGGVPPTAENGQKKIVKSICHKGGGSGGLFRGRGP